MILNGYNGWRAAEDTDHYACNAHPWLALERAWASGEPELVRCEECEKEEAARQRAEFYRSLSKDQLIGFLEMKEAAS